ncbi:N-acetylglutaminylglutamine amidotransferase [Marinobacterium mangrovicola]|uniref:asparagine synthase (glutamine-hydrolyzing) n=1 Tax=Marinobacterium mangrovicola TaxID=1476959 RepID=A0A4R1G7C1_9GAMM|nr:N-acetylglutaminylglutamine amidotransferase [Marinobacterium mangrovicola]TCK02571.1 asparagine synthase (glutamine-hydrolysing) [Marinobacterium mangrovicola]
MCGICGEIIFDGSTPSVTAVERMAEKLRPRGPDAGGIYSQKNIVFGHRRLKIIDLSDHAQQPMHDPDLGLTLVFNGCIYNYKELREELQARGYRFFSSGDTEVILKAFHAWGPDCVSRFNGMFAFAIHNRDTGRVVMARDRFGIKPFYYSEQEGKLRFASSLPALLAAGGVDTEIDPVALHHYMQWHAVVPPPYTLLKGVRKLPPATYRVIEADGSYKDTRYWTQTMGPKDKADEGKTQREWEDELLEAMRRSVARRAVADVPVGVLLSGGLDSSLIVGLLAEHGQAGLNTFSVGFEAAGGEKGDEFKYSDIIANHYNTEHHQIMVPSSRLLETLPETFGAMSEPMVSYDNVGFYLLSHEVSKHLKVVQSGQGADEVFGGYHWYPPMLNSEDAVEDYSKAFFDRSEEEFAEAISADFVGDNYSRQFVENYFAGISAPRPVDKALHIDTNVMLVDDPVKRVDNMTMAWGLEARVPFLDHEVVELAGRIPAELKVKDSGKYVLKEMARRIIPNEVIDRPKGYFPVPALKYIEGPYLEFVRDFLDSDTCRQRGLFRREYLDQLMDAPRDHITPLRGSKLWQVALLEMWLQTHGV